MTNDELIAAARARLARCGACSNVMKEVQALIEALDARTEAMNAYRRAWVGGSNYLPATDHIRELP